MHDSTSSSDHIEDSANKNLIKLVLPADCKVQPIFDTKGQVTSVRLVPSRQQDVISAGNGVVVFVRNIKDLGESVVIHL